MMNELEDMCKQLHIASVYQSILEQCGSDQDVISVFMQAWQSELNIRMTNRQDFRHKKDSKSCQYRNYQMTGG
jgi:hypothetical protein